MFSTKLLFRLIPNLIVVAIAMSVIIAAQHPAAASASAGNNDAIVVYSAGLDAMLSDPRDQALKRAVRMLEQRVMDLPAELGEEDIPAPLIRSVMHMMLSPMNLRVGMVDNPEEAPGPPFYAQLTVNAKDEEDAARQARALFSMITELAGPAPVSGVHELHPEVQVLDLGGMPGYFGSANVGDDPSIVLAVNQLEDKKFDLRQFPQIDGVKPVFAMDIDSEKLRPFVDMGLQQASPDERDAVRAQLSMMGFYGENPMRIRMSSGYAADRAMTKIVLNNYASMESVASVLVTKSIDSEVLKLIPADATYAQVGKANFSGYADMLRSTFQQIREADPDSAGEIPTVDQIMAEIENEIGIHPERDVLNHFGETYGMYMSDTTGGGGLLSLVTFAEVKDESALQETMSTLHDKINSLAKSEAKGYVRIQNREVNGVEMTSLLFPGLPVPLELSWKIGGGHLWFALSPEALIAAERQARRKGDDLTDNPRFAELAADGGIKDAIAISFTDTPRLARDGYGLASLGMAALSNVVRSPSDRNREPGLVMPTYDELMNDVRGSLTVTRVDGSDLIIDLQQDRSLLVNLSAGIGAIKSAFGGVMAAGLGGGMLLPALAEARASAKTVKSAAQLRQLGMAGQMWATEHEGELPTSVDEMIEMDYITHDLLDSPIGDVHDEHGDYWVNTSVRRTTDLKEPHKTVAAYDRAAYAEYETVPVLFFDGHVQMIEPWEFEELMQQPQHEGVDFRSPHSWD